MNSIGSILASTTAAPNTAATPAAAPLFDPLRSEPRLFKVKLAVQIVAEIEVMARTPEHAGELARERATEAKRLYRTEPYDFSYCISKPVDVRDVSKGFKWIRLEQVRGGDGRLFWQPGQDEY